LAFKGLSVVVELRRWGELIPVQCYNYPQDHHANVPRIILPSTLIATI